MNLPRLGSDIIEKFILEQLNKAGLGQNTFTAEALALIIRSGEGLIRRTRNLCLGTQVEAVCGFSKKGEASVGVARQYNGRMGKVDNCQVGVFATLSLGKRSTLFGSRLFLPEAWSKNQRRCEKVGTPKEQRVHRTKSELAWGLFETIENDGVKFGWVGFDAAYGRDQNLLLKIAGLGKTFVADVDCDQRV